MKVLRHLILLLIASLIGSIFIKEPLPPDLANFVIACVATLFIYKNLKEELKGEEGKSKIAGDPKIGTICLFSDDEEEFNKNLGQVDILSDIDDQRMRKYISKSCDSWKYCKQIKIKEDESKTD